MATNEISGSDSESHCSSVASIGSSMYAVPDDILETIFQRLNASDLCSVASCCRWLRDATNQDTLWRPLCQSREWEHYGNTTDLAKIASYGPSEQETGATKAVHDRCVTFQNDRIVTGDNTSGLTSTCRWKGVYMRAHHLNRNWATNCAHFRELDVNMYRHNIFFPEHICVDGDILAVLTSMTVFVFDIRKDTLECVIHVPNNNMTFKIKDGVMVVACLNGIVRAFDARTGQMLQVMKECRPWRIQELFFDGELVIASTYGSRSLFTGDSFYIYVWDVQDGKRRPLEMDEPTGDDELFDLDYRNKLLAAAHSDNYIRVWDARSGEFLHKLKCPGETSNVKLGENVIVGLSTNNSAICVLSIWSLDTGECQKKTSFRCVNKSNLYLVNNLIIIQGHFDTRGFSVMFAYDLRGTLVTKNTLIEYEACSTLKKANGRMCSFNLFFGQKEKQYKEFIFEATPNGLVRLVAADPDLRDAEIIVIRDSSSIITGKLVLAFDQGNALAMIMTSCKSTDDKSSNPDLARTFSSPHYGWQLWTPSITASSAIVTKQNKRH